MVPEGALLSRRSILLCGLLGLLLFVGAWGWLGGRTRWQILSSSTQQPAVTALPTIEKQPVAFETHTFDPIMPPPEMPPLGEGETAECESNFTSSASVSGQSRRTDASHAMLTITQVKVTLGLEINIWLPMDATQHVIEHEDGHRQISEYYYQNADKLAERIAATYMGKKMLVTGSDLDAELNNSLKQAGAEITDEYDKELNSETTQLRYDDITDHSRNEVSAADAVDQALKDASVDSTEPAATEPGN
jgi:hypothetical protein